MGYYRRRKDTSLERALQHLEEAREFSQEIGGYDRDVKDYFFKLPARELNTILAAYGRKFGSKPEGYARKTFPDWRSGKRGMSGLVAKRLFELLPPAMPLAKKYELADNLWRHFAPKTLHHFTISQDTTLADIAIPVQNTLNQVITLHNIPANIKNRFNWLCAGDIHAEEQMLNYFRQREKELIMTRLALEIPLLQNQLKTHPELTASLKSEFRINNNRIIITVAQAHPSSIPDNHTAPSPQPPAKTANASTAFQLILIVLIGIIIIMMAAHR